MASYCCLTFLRHHIKFIVILLWRCYWWRIPLRLQPDIWIMSGSKQASEFPPDASYLRISVFHPIYMINQDTFAAATLVARLPLLVPAFAPPTGIRHHLIDLHSLPTGLHHSHQPSTPHTVLCPLLPTSASSYQLLPLPASTPPTIIHPSYPSYHPPPLLPASIPFYQPPPSYHPSPLLPAPIPPTILHPS